jgi:DNA-binding GntR family transcriptional regulator
LADRLTKTPLYQQAYEQLRDRIASGQFQPGDRVDVQTVANELGISRTPVREAIRQLIQDGLIEAERDGRARVYNPSVESLAEIYVVRAALESAAVTVAATLYDLDLTELRASHQESLAAMEAGDSVRVSQCNTRFHDGLLLLAENQTIRKTLDTLRFHIVRFRLLSMQFPERRKNALEAHEEILALLADGDSSASERTYAHVLQAGTWAIGMLKPDSVNDTPSITYLRRAHGGSPRPN